MELRNDYIQAADPLSSIEELRKFLKSKDIGIRFKLAENLASPPDVLAQLSNDPDPEVRACVACNPSTPSKIVTMLSEDEHDDVRFSMASDPNLPFEILYKLVHDQNPYVCDRAQKTVDGLALESVLEGQGFISFPGTHARLGELLVAAKIMQEAEIEAFVNQARSNKIPLGRALVQAGRIDRHIVAYALKFQTLIRLGQATLESAITQIKEYAGAQ